MALLAGDGLLNLAFETILSPKNRGSLTAEGVQTQGKQVFRHCDKLTGWKK